MSNKDIKAFIDLLNTIAFMDLPIACPINKKDKLMVLKGGSPDANSINALTTTINNSLESLSTIPNVKNNVHNLNSINASSTTNYTISEINNPFALAGNLLQHGVDPNKVMEFASQLNQQNLNTQLLLADKKHKNELEIAKLEQNTIAEIELADTYYKQKISTVGFLGGSVISTGLSALTYNGASQIISPMTNLLGFGVSSGAFLKNIDANYITEYITSSGIEVPWGTQTIFGHIVSWLSQIIVLLLNGCFNTAGTLIEGLSAYIKGFAESSVLGASVAVFCFSIITTFLTIAMLTKAMDLESIKLSPLGPEIRFSNRKERRSKKSFNKNNPSVTIEELNGGYRKNKSNKNKK